MDRKKEIKEILEVAVNDLTMLALESQTYAEAYSLAVKALDLCNEAEEQNHVTRTVQ